MIDMRGMESLASYTKAVKAFKKKFPANKECHEVEDCDEYWKLFKNSFREKSKSKCPICEDTINRYDDIDHYRPKDSYKFLKCCCINYMLMCSDCNRAYKRATFPITGLKASTISDLDHELPLLINPRFDNVLEYFDLIFLPSKTGKNILELHPKRGLDPIKKARAEETIKLYGIGYCDSNRMVDECRINIFELHYESFIQFAKAKKLSIEEFEKLKKNKDHQKKMEYGFIHFIENNQFKIIE